MSKRGREGRWTGALEKAARTKQEAKVLDALGHYIIKKDPAGVGTGTVYLVNDIPQGTGQGQRIGNTVYLRSCELKLLYTQNGTVQQARFDRTRVALVWDRQPTTALPTYEDIFKDTYWNGTTFPSTPMSWPNRDNCHRFLILKDYLNQLPEVHNPVSSSQTSTLGAMQVGGAKSNVLKDFIDLSGLTSVYRGITGSDIKSGCLYVVYQGDYIVSQAAWMAEVNLRLRYDEEQ